MKHLSTSSQVPKDWYKTWFNTPYYEMLYQHHDDSEARRFIDLLIQLLQPAPGDKVLDLACGKGRHARYLAGKGMDVTGIDLSINSILAAREYENEHLAFFSHDMRKPFRSNYFQYVFNFFTSFGYFQSEKDDLRTLKMVRNSLVPGGIFVLDFFNSAQVKAPLPKSEEVLAGGIHFSIYKRVVADRVLKTIRFHADGRDWVFEEKVRLFSMADFQALFDQAQLKIETIFGSYQLEPYDETRSPRLILIARKV